MDLGMRRKVGSLAQSVSILPKIYLFILLQLTDLIVHIYPMQYDSLKHIHRYIVE